MPERLVVVGGDAAGMSAASTARRADPDLEIVVCERGSWTSYSACGIPYLVGGEIGGLDELVVRSPEEFRKRGIDARVGHEVVSVDTDAGEVSVLDHAGERSYRLGYDQLLLATGSRPRRPPLPGIDAGHVMGVQTLADAQRLVSAVEGRRVEHVVVVGANYVGLEIAEAFLRRGAAVTLVDRGDQVMDPFDADMAHLVQAAMECMGIEVRLEDEVVAVEADAVITSADKLPADVVVLGLGVTPNSDLASAAGIPTGVRGAIVVDRRQHTPVEGVWAAGDCVQSTHLISGRPVHVPLGTVANRQGRVAGVNLGGGYATFPGVLGTAITRVCALEAACTGLTEDDATAAGFVVDVARATSSTRAGYLPDAKEVTVKLVVERGTRRLLGGQVVGEEGVLGIVDTLATALTARFTIADLLDLDLAYAPPFTPLWGPLQSAARAVPADPEGRTR